MTDKVDRPGLVTGRVEPPGLVTHRLSNSAAW
jgi:hypothetical protein